MELTPGMTVEGEDQKGFYFECDSEGPVFFVDGEKNWAVINEQAPPLSEGNSGGYWLLDLSLAQHKEEAANGTRKLKEGLARRLDAPEES